MPTSRSSPMTFKVIFIDLILALGKHGSFEAQNSPKLKHIKMHLTPEKCGLQVAEINYQS